LLGAKGEEKKIPWVKWNVVCSPKERGGLGIKNLEVFNRALLGKWLWRALSENESFWKEILVEKFGIRN